MLKLKKSIEYIKSSTQKIGKINEKALQATSSEQENELSRQLRSLVVETNKRAKDTKDLLVLLKQDNCEGNPSDLRYVLHSKVIIVFRIPGLIHYFVLLFTENSHKRNINNHNDNNFK